MSNDNVLRWSETLAAIANTGLAFTENLYEQERFHEVLKVAAEMRASTTAENSSPFVDEVFDAWVGNIGSGVPGYVTPKIAVGAAVRRNGNELLLIQRSDSGHWLYPTGWADVGYAPAEVALKEVLEETGVTAKIVRPIAIFDSYQIGISNLAFYSLIFLCDYVSGELQGHELECRDLGWFTSELLPEPLAGHRRWVDIVFDAFANDEALVFFDQPRSDKMG